MFRRAHLLLCTLAACVPLFSADILVGPASLKSFEFRKGKPENATLEVVAARGPGFTSALRYAATAKAAGRVQAETAISQALQRDDILLASFSLRSTGSGEPEVTISVEPGVTQWSMPLNMPAPAGKNWRKYQFSFQALRSFDAGQARLVLSFGPDVQTVEIGGIELVNYGKTKTLAELPSTHVPYPGEELNASWRKEAAARIEQIRKAGLTVTAKDKSGRPLRNAAVSVRMRKHAFGFGTAVSGRLLTSSRLSADDVQKYREHITKLFTKAVMDNDLKWPQWDMPGARPLTIKAVQWLRDSGIEVRGHNLIWPSWRWMPASAAKLKDDPAALSKHILDHIADVGGTMREQLTEWDVINEPFSNHDAMDILGRHSMVDWFKAAEKAAPGTKLYINDFNILSGNDTKHQDHYSETIAYLLEQGARVDGIGLQCHFPAKVTAIQEVLKRIDRFAKFGKLLEVTEFDVDTNDERLQADYTRDIMTVVFSRPEFNGFIMWGFWEPAHWKPKTAMYRRDWSIKPNGQAYNDLVFKQWWTNADGKTNAEGKYTVRGFLGDYEIAVTADGKTQSRSLKLPKEGAAVDVVID